MKKLITEFIGTFFLVLFAGMGNPLAVAAILTAMIYAGGPISGAHYNPAVTLGVFMVGKISSKKAALYMLFQLLGGLVAAATFSLLAGQKMVVAPSAPAQIAFAVEAIFTFGLVYTVLQVAVSPRAEGKSYYGAAIGLALFAAALAGGQVSGGAFNPSVGLSPILFDVANITKNAQNALLYTGGPFLGGAIAALVYRFMK